MKVKQVIKILEANGWTHSRTKGDHRVFTKPGQRPIVIAGHENDDMPKGTESAILRQANLKKS